MHNLGIELAKDAIYGWFLREAKQADSAREPARYKPY